MKKDLRISWLSFLCSVFVVGIHLPFSHSGSWVGVKSLFSEGLCRVAVPYFFICAGYHLAVKICSDGWYRDAVKKRMRTLLVPYLIWCMAGALVMDGTLGHALGIDFTAYPTYYPLWFIRSLLLLIVISPIINWIFGLGWYWVLGYFILLIINFALASRLREASGLYRIVMGGLTPVGLTYFSFGMILPRFAGRLRFEVGLARIVFALGIALLGGATVVESHRVSEAILHLGVICFLSGVLPLIPNRGLPSAFEGMSFPIYLLHLLLLTGISGMLRMFNVPISFDMSIGGYFFYWISAVLMSVLATKILRAVSPRLTVLVFGGRVS